MGCTQRRIGCHGSCERYKRERLYWDTQIEARRKWSRGVKFETDDEYRQRKIHRDMRRTYK